MSTWGEASYVIGLWLNIFHALLLSCPRNKRYTCVFSQLWDILLLHEALEVVLAYLCVKIHQATLHWKHLLASWHRSPYQLFCMTTRFGCIACCVGKAFVAALCNDFDNPCVISSRDTKRFKSSMSLCTPQLYTPIVSQVKRYLACQVPFFAYTSY